MEKLDLGSLMQITRMVAILSLLGIAQCLPDHVSDTLLPDNPFVAIWNVPSGNCPNHFGVNLNLSAFDIVANPNESFIGPEMAIFYRIGLFPSYDSSGNPVNGGLPQLGNLTKHLEQVEKDVVTIIPDVNFIGLSVLDFESWRPVYDRNHYNDVMKIYMNKSEELVKTKHPSWTDAQVKAEAKLEFETGARAYMEQTLEMCKKLRPHGHWGYYGFPQCYNGLGKVDCGRNAMFNDRINWLFNASTSLVPSIYLSSGGTAHDRKLQVRGNLVESLRVERLYGSPYVPILPYSRYRYRGTNAFYITDDLESTVKQLMDAGLAGVAFWDSSSSFRSRDDCLALQWYLDVQLGPIVRAATNFARACSKQYCNNGGRCVQPDWNTTATEVDQQLPNVINDYPSRDTRRRLKNRFWLLKTLRKKSQWYRRQRYNGIRSRRKYFKASRPAQWLNVVEGNHMPKQPFKAPWRANQLMKDWRQSFPLQTGSDTRIYSDAGYTCRCYRGRTGKQCETHG